MPYTTVTIHHNKEHPNLEALDNFKGLERIPPTKVGILYLTREPKRKGFQIWKPL
jgi:hypothetical protein